ncbi:hypothetical protein FA10DRAFT_15726 [Acaromyces ingoldii]|uniref:Uncharacterized protein n=1 Tax=Acaromyces ingoldii TaxID=215250 RepID=A0A316YV80_9BASI|nr:hypothetical protein FA10DRAFT_15726 [Acaromyces ingoldii]PWN93189.1 hypothetical protein FA10DRAFT_15726 [Acaromyces ingoldii]
MNAAGSSKVQRKTAPAAPVAQTQRPGEPQTSGARQESSSGTTTIAKGAVTTASPRDEAEADQQTTPRPDLPSSGHGELPSILMTPRAGNTTPRVGTATPTFSTMPRPHSSPGLDASDTQRLRSQKLATSSKASTMSRTPNALKNARNKLGSIARSRDSFFSPTSSADAAYNGDVVGEKAGRSKGSQSNQVGVANTAPPVSASAALASELNDLAVAHDEGLLGEEEYRLLRQGAFDRLMKNGAMELPQEGAIRGLGVVSADPDATIPRRRDTEPLASVLEQQQQQQQQKQQQQQQQQPYSRERASTLSQTPSVLSLLRRASLLSGKGSEKRASTDQHQHLDPSSSSTASVRQHASNPTLGGRRLTNDSGSLFASNSSRVHSQYSGTSGGHGGTPSSTTRSLSNLRRGGSRRKKERAEELEEAYRTARSTRSLRGAASQILVDPSSSLGVGDDSNASVARMSAMGLSISNGTSLLGVDYADKSSSEIKAERAVVEAEYARLLESFSAMEQMSMGRYSTLDYQQLKKAWALSALNHGGTMPDDIEDPDGNFVLVEGGGESEPAGTQTTKDGKRSSQTGKSNIRKTRSGPLLQPFNSSTGAASGSASSLNGAALLSPPSSYRGPGSPASSSPNNRSRTSLTSLSPPSSPNAPVRGGRAAGSYFSGAVIEAPLDEARSSGNTDEETAQRLILSLKTDLDEIAKRKQDVAAKYSARLDFLKSATRSALIREGLKR